MITHLISDPIQILSPSRNGKVVIEYASGRRAIVDTTELDATCGISEINQAIGSHNNSWDYSTWVDPEKWTNNLL
ncbi:MAG TPA: hypothetical protein VMC85_20850 [Desulfomonilaceae bacterium]|nr:hypothetical protein [Desulfomonilaceae bacterium]